MKKLILAAMLSAGLQPALAASFTCEGDLSAQEKLICADKEVSSLDSRLSALYEIALAVLKDTERYEQRAALKADQRNWVARVRARCDSAGCLGKLYRDRVSYIEGVVSESSTRIDRPFSGGIGWDCAGSSGDWLDISVRPGKAPGEVNGSVGGTGGCNQKVWRDLPLAGVLKGNVAEVRFSTGSAHEERWYEAYIALVVVTHSDPKYDKARMYWRVVKHPVEDDPHLALSKDMPMRPLDTSEKP